MEDKKLAEIIVEKVGGKENINELTHCATRLRFVVSDEKKVSIPQLSALEGVITAQNRGGQIQIVIGAKVDYIYDEVVKLTGISGGVVDDDGKLVSSTKRNPINTFLETVAAIFTPILPALIGCGMMQVLSKVLVQIGVVDASSGFVTIINMIGGCVFYFMPFFLAVSAARKFKTNEFIAVALAACYLHPTILGAEGPINFLMLSIPKVSYTSTVIPIIFSVYVLSYVYKNVNKLIPDIVKIIFVPMITLVIMVPLQLIVLGPIGAYCGSAVAGVITALFNLNGIIAGAVLGFFRPILVMFGMHYSIMPMQIQQIADLGYTVLTPSSLCANLAQAGAAFGVFLKVKNKTMKAASSSASITAVFGITEPAIYGVTLRYKKPFFAGCAAAAITSGFLGAVGGRASSVVLPGILAIPVFEADNFIYIVIAVAASFALGAVFTYLIGFDEVEL